MNKTITLGVWLGFFFPVVMYKEGIHIYNIHLLLSLLKYKNIHLEFWLFEVNNEEFKATYKPILDQYPNRIKVHFIKDNVVSILCKNIFRFLGPKKAQGAKTPNTAKVKNSIKKVIYNPKIRSILWLALQKFSDLLPSVKIGGSADVFLVPVIGLKNAINVDKPKILIFHDLFPAYFCRYFAGFQWVNKKIAQYLIDVGERLAAQGTQFVAPSNFVREQHGLHYIKNLKDEQIVTIYSPLNIPKDGILPQKKLFDKFDLKAEQHYFIYPSQNRPYKNIITLLKAFKRVLEKENCYLLLNCMLDRVPEVEAYVKENNLRNRIILLGNLSNSELYSFYTYSIAAVIPTLGEAGFPWQAMEGLYTKTPVIATNIPVTLERLKFMGFTHKNSGLLLFDSDNVEQLTKHMIYALHNRDKIVASQTAVRKKLMEYTWDDVANEYYKLIVIQSS